MMRRRVRRPGILKDDTDSGITFEKKVLTSSNNHYTVTVSDKWYQGYAVQNLRDETVYLMCYDINNGTDSVVAKIKSGETVNDVFIMSGNSKDDYITLYVVNSPTSENFMEMIDCYKGDPYGVVVNKDCYYNNTATLKFSNTCGESLKLYLNGEYKCSIANGKTATVEISGDEEYSFQAKKDDGMYYYGSGTLSSCDTKTWVLGDN